MQNFAIVSMIGLWLAVLLFFSVVTVRYRITNRHLVISWLGMPVRWVKLSNIKQITLQRLFWTERWFNSLTPGNRYLLIEKNFSLVFRHLSITPKNYLVFKADLERARDQLIGEATKPQLNATAPSNLPEAASTPSSSH